MDDGLDSCYRNRIKQYEIEKALREERRQQAEDGVVNGGSIVEEEEDDITNPSNSDDSFYALESHPDVPVGNDGLYIPAYIYENLFTYQHEGLEWLWKLHRSRAGGILGDDMGLGKTVQIVAFIATLATAGLLSSGGLILCPGSVMFHWVREFHRWAPNIRVMVLHSAGSGNTSTDRQKQNLVKKVKNNVILVTTYGTFRSYQHLLTHRVYDYVVLDEGHRIRNCNADITLAVKTLRCDHRVILTGSPIQNHLKELWSLFDFVFPGRLGTLPTFEDEFVVPIRAGAFVNASKLQIRLAYKTALSLQSLVKPYLLRRMKKDVIATKLPDKVENVIFCSLSVTQRQMYEEFLESNEVDCVVNRVTKPFKALGVLRKICNHPMLFHENTTSCDLIKDAGKMMVVDSILPLWYSQGHRVLLFSQTRSMLDLIESYVCSKKYKYVRLDGSTPMNKRQGLIDAFNNKDEEIFIFLLTTRAGGIGINLTGGNRVLIYDPDWNPSTDVQARERAWRLGQEKNVVIFRLISVGTIEEKIYHRQIFKQYITDKILKNAKNRRKFTRNTLKDLFTLADDTTRNTTATDGTGTETGDLYLAGHVASTAAEAQAVLESNSNSFGATVKTTTTNSMKSKSTSDDDETKEDDSSKKDSEEIMKSLFQGGEIKSVFSHDALEADDGIHNQEYELIEMEATRLANDAVRALKRSEQRISASARNNSYTPTWTGTAGTNSTTTTAAPPKSPKATTTPRSIVGKRNREDASNTSASSLLMSQIRNRNVSTPKRICILSAHEIASALVTFLNRKASRSALTSDILQEFKTSIKPESKLVFRETLHNVATRTNKSWTLKPEYQS